MFSCITPERAVGILHHFRSTVRVSSRIRLQVIGCELFTFVFANYLTRSSETLFLILKAGGSRLRGQRVKFAALGIPVLESGCDRSFAKPAQVSLRIGKQRVVVLIPSQMDQIFKHGALPNHINRGLVLPEPGIGAKRLLCS